MIIIAQNLLVNFFWDFEQFEKYGLVICDEFGYISFDKAGAELLFTHLSLRAGRKATLITTNLAFDRWQDEKNGSVHKFGFRRAVRSRWLNTFWMDVHVSKRTETPEIRQKAPLLAYACVRKSVQPP